MSATRLHFKTRNKNVILQLGIDPPYMGFREDAATWQNETWEDAAKRLGVDAETRQVIQDLKIMEKSVSGNSVQGLPKDTRSEGNLPRVFLFTKIFQDLAYTGNPHPAQFISSICDKYKKVKEKREDYSVPISGICARGMRTLASFYREVDFRERFALRLSEKGLGQFKIIQNPEEDTKGHADLIIKFSDREFRIWLFQITDRGIVNTSDRLVGNRGDLVRGTHIICGQDTEDQDQVDAVCGWHLYSQKIIDDCLNEISRILENQIKPTAYDDVKKILNGPKEFLSKVNSFHVE